MKLLLPLDATVNVIEEKYTYSLLNGLWSIERQIYLAKVAKPTRKDGDRCRYYAWNIIDLDGNVITVREHRIVAENWLPNPHDYKHVHHKDEDRFNNSPFNLAWIHPSDHARKHLHRFPC